MPKWSRTLWQNRNKFFGLLAIIAIVLAAVWFYGGDRSERIGSVGDASGNSSIEVSRNEDHSAKADSGNSGTESGGAGSPQETVPDRDEPSSVLQPGGKEATPLAESGDSGAAQGTAGELAAKAEESSTALPDGAVQPNAGKQAGEGKKFDDAEGVKPQPVQSGSGAAISSTPPGSGALPGKDSATDAAAGSGGSVTLTIVGPPDIGTIMGTTEVDIGDSKSVLDVLKKTTRSQKLQMEYTGSGATAYVQGIDNLYEFDKGSGSGWMYSVNGKFPNRSAGIWPLSPGDDIRWLYTEDLGKDLGAGAEDGLWDGKS
ncbi:DUF4430 domain-containing protein [Paenibacillus sp. YSY-4.3]